MIKSFTLPFVQTIRYKTAQNNSIKAKNKPGFQQNSSAATQPVQDPQTTTDNLSAFLDQFQKPMGITSKDGKTAANIWAPACEQVEVEYIPDIKQLENPDLLWEYDSASPQQAKKVVLKNVGGMHVLADNAGEIQPGMPYRLILHCKDGTTHQVADPDARAMPWDTGGWSRVEEDIDIRPNLQPLPRRRSQERVVLQTHVGLATPEGNFPSLKRKLSNWQRIGVTDVQPMPTGASWQGGRELNGQGQVWGYDNESDHVPIEEAEFNKAANHERIGVIGDRIWNHNNNRHNARRLMDPDLETPEAYWGNRPNHDHPVTRRREIESSARRLKLGETGSRGDSVHNVQNNHATDPRMATEHLRNLHNFINTGGGVEEVGPNGESRYYTTAEAEIRGACNNLVDCSGTENPQGIGCQTIIDIDANSNYQKTKSGQQWQVREGVDYLFGQGTENRQVPLSMDHDGIAGQLYPENGKGREIVRDAKRVSDWGSDYARAKINQSHELDNTIYAIREQIAALPENDNRRQYLEARLASIVTGAKATVDANTPVLKAKAHHRIRQAGQYMIAGTPMIFDGDEAGNTQPLKWFYTEMPGETENGENLRGKLKREKGYDPADQRLQHECKINPPYTVENELLRDQTADLAQIRRGTPALTNGLTDPEHLHTYVDNQCAYTVARTNESPDSSALGVFNPNENMRITGNLDSGAAMENGIPITAEKAEILSGEKLHLAHYTGDPLYDPLNTDPPQVPLGIKVPEDSEDSSVPVVNLAPNQAAIYTDDPELTRRLIQRRKQIS